MGGIIYVTYFFEECRDGTAYYIKMDITGGIYGIKTGVCNDKIVSGAFGTGCKWRIVNSRRYIRQTVKGYERKRNRGTIYDSYGSYRR